MCGVGWRWRWAEMGEIKRMSDRKGKKVFNDAKEHVVQIKKQVAAQR